MSSPVMNTPRSYEKPEPTGRPRRIKVTFVLPALQAGGAERVLITLMNGLDPQEFERSFITVSEKGPMRELVQKDIPFYSLGKEKRVSRALPALYHTLKKIRPDIVISTMAHMNFALLILKPFFPRTRFVVREAVTPSYFFEKKSLRSFLIKCAYKFLYPRADLVFSPARLINDEFASLLKMDNSGYKVLPNPVDRERINPSPVPSPDNEKIHFVCAGRLHPQKGYDRLIEALQKNPPPFAWHLTILGEGEERAALEQQIAEAGLQDNISLPGHAERPWDIIAASDCLLMPSRWEGLPNVVLEALACGTPCIVTRESGGIAEIAENSRGDALKVANNMDEFSRLINLTSKKATTVSLLPAAYEKEHVLENFSALIKRTNSFS